MGVDDILFTLFRHKQIILAGFILGILGAGIVRVVYHPMWVSEAKLNVPYIAEHLPAGPVDPEIFPRTLLTSLNPSEFCPRNHALPM